MEQNLQQPEQPYHPKHHIKVYVWIALVVASLGVAANGYVYFLRLAALQRGAEIAQQDAQRAQELREQRGPAVSSGQYAVPLDWKTYTNTEYGFEFRYPKEMVANTEIKNRIYLFTAENHKLFQEKKLTRTGDIVAFTNANLENKPAAEFYNSPNSIFINPQTIKVGSDISAFEVKDCGFKDQECMIVPGKGYFVEFYNMHSDDKLIYQILSTFRFIDTVDISTWQTYRNEEYGFEFKYPGDWEVLTRGDHISLMPIGGQDVSLIIYVFNKSINEAEKLMPVFSVSGRSVDSRATLMVGPIQWTKLIVDKNQVVQLTYWNGKTYGAQYSTLENVSTQILSTFKFIE